MDHKHECNDSNCMSTNSSVRQTISEMDWERGIWNAAFNGDKDKVQILINKARNANEFVNTPDNSGYTALHFAARSGHVDVCKLLIDNGAFIDVQTRNGKATPLHKAAASGKIEAIKFLIQAGASIATQDVDGQTALHKAVDNGKLDVVNVLLEKFPQLADIKDVKGRLAIQPSTD